MIPKTAFRILASLPIACVAGNVVFAILADGTWLTALLRAILEPSAFDVLVLAALWITRVGVFIALLVGWAFADGDAVSPAAAGNTRGRRDHGAARASAPPVGVETSPGATERQRFQRTGPSTPK